MSSPIEQIQMQIKRNAEETSTILSDIAKWTSDMKEKDEEITKSTRKTKKDEFPPVRNTEQLPFYGDNENFGAEPKKKAKIAPAISITPAKATDIFSESDVQSDTKNLEEDAQDFKDKGNSFYKQENWEKALEAYSASLKLKEDSVVYANRAAVYIKLNRNPEAELDCTKSIALDRASLKSYLRRGLVRRNMGKMKESVEDFEIALCLKPKHPDILKELDISKNLLKESKKNSPEEQEKRKLEEERQKKEKEEKERKQKEEKERKEKEERERKEKERKEQEEALKKEQEKPKKKKIQIEDVDENEIQTKPTEEEEEIEEFVTPSARNLIKEVGPTKTEAQKPTPKPETPKEKQNFAQSPQKKPASVNPADIFEEISKQVKIEIKVPEIEPKTAYEFEKNFKVLKGDNLLQYLKIISPKNFKRLFKENFSQEFFVAFIETADNLLMNENSGDNLKALEIIRNLPTITRFDMVALFLGDQEKKILKKVFDTLSQRMASNFSPEIEKLKSSYSL